VVQPEEDPQRKIQKIKAGAPWSERCPGEKECGYIAKGSRGTGRDRVQGKHFGVSMRTC